MKRKDIKQLQGKSIAELTKEIGEKRFAITKHVLERRVKQIKNTRLVKSLRDDTARIATVLRIKQLEKKQEKKA